MVISRKINAPHAILIEKKTTHGKKLLLNTENDVGYNVAITEIDGRKWECVNLDAQKLILHASFIFPFTAFYKSMKRGLIDGIVAYMR